MNKPAWNKSDIAFMTEAFREADRAKGTTLPNPPVGAILVKAGKVVARGRTSPAGGPHAEIAALNKAKAKSRGATLYVTLEPCCHYGRTPPCVSQILQSEVKRVVISAVDPNPVVKGKGVKQLRKAGIKVEVGILEEYAESFYEYYGFFARFNRPKIILKIAQSLDGRINEQPGVKTAITGRDALRWTHELRNRVDAVVIGAGTLKTDNPDLSPRFLKSGRRHFPEAVVLTRKGKIHLSRKLLQPNRKGGCLIISGKAVKLPKWLELQVFPKGRTGIKEIISILTERGYHGVLVEGGADVLCQWLKSEWWDTFYILTSAKIFPNGLKWSEGLPSNWQEFVEFDKFCHIGKDMVIEAVPKRVKRK